MVHVIDNTPNKEAFLAALARQRERKRLLEHARKLGDAAFAHVLVSIREEADADATLIAEYLLRAPRK